MGFYYLLFSNVPKRAVNGSVISEQSLLDFQAFLGFDRSFIQTAKIRNVYIGPYCRP